MMKDYYTVLGVERDAPKTVIKAAYRRLARAHHPDLATERGTGELRVAELKMREINEAYAAVRSDQRRRMGPLDSHGAPDQSPDDRGTSDPGAPPHGAGTEIPSSANDPTRRMQRTTVSSAVLEGLVLGFVEKLGQRMQHDQVGLKLAPAHVDGFKLAFRGKLDGVRYTVAVQTRSHLDPTKAAEFVRSAMSAVDREHSALRNSVFIFMLAYGSADGLEAVVRAVSRLPSGAKRGHEHDECVVALLPALGGQSVVFGNALKTVEPLRAVMARLLPGAAIG